MYKLKIADLIIDVLANNEPIIYGTPWMGKERYGCNSKAKLAKVDEIKSQIDDINT